MRTGTRNRNLWERLSLQGLILVLFGCAIAFAQEAAVPETGERVVATDPSLQGTVVDEAGHPVDAVKISNWFPYGSMPQDTYTKKDGLFYFPERRGYALRADKKGFAPAFVEFRDLYFSPEAKQGALTIDVTMTPGGTVGGTVVDKESGDPIPGAAARVIRAAEDPHVGLGPYDIWTSEPVVTDASGRFEFEHVPPGRCRVAADLDGYKENESAEFTMESGAAEEVKIALQKQTDAEIQEEHQREDAEQRRRVLPLLGVVRDADGNPLGGVRVVNIYPHSTNPQETFTNIGGEFQFDRIYGPLVVATKEGYAPGIDEFRDEFYENRKQLRPTERALTLTHGGAVQGTVLDDETDKPVADAEVWAYRRAEETDAGNNRYTLRVAEPVTCDEQGHFRLPCLPGGTLRLHAAAPGFAEWESAEFSVEDGGTRDLSPRLDRGAELIVHVLDKETGNPVPDATLSFQGSYPLTLGLRDPSPKLEAAANKEGQAVIRNIPPNEYWLECKSRNYHEFRTQVNFAENEKTKTLRIELVRINPPGK